MNNTWKTLITLITILILGFALGAGMIIGFALGAGMIKGNNVGSDTVCQVLCSNKYNLNNKKNESKWLAASKQCLCISTDKVKQVLSLE